MQTSLEFWLQSELPWINFWWPVIYSLQIIQHKTKQSKMNLVTDVVIAKSVFQALYSI